FLTRHIFLLRRRLFRGLTLSFVVRLMRSFLCSFSFKSLTPPLISYKILWALRRHFFADMAIDF
ncbi:MAG: hypothetical protein II622_00250, partial [Thermoguttaceae bacterium]|nr:hypothetical protein [Thermoguttaceae bacterium]